MEFKLQKTNNRARAGQIETAHGVVPTPVFLPVGSQAAVKTLTPQEVSGIGYRMLLANTYHLYLRPGTEIVAKFDGLHRFMDWEGAILTDSGGYQIFSLAGLRKVDDEGVTFRSHIDGSSHFITPEKAAELQQDLGADIIMVLDECPPSDADFNKTRQAMRRTRLWAERCLKAHKNSGQQALFAIVQGGLFPELRKQSARGLVELDFPGYAIGGLSLGEPKETTYEITAQTAALLPADKPRYLMGVGSPEDIVEAVAEGIDIFDSALPTRVARNGALFTRRGRISINNVRYKNMEEPLDVSCDCYTCRSFPVAYLHHLFRCGELLALRLATLHNLTFMHKLMQDIRAAVLDDSYAAFRGEFLKNYRVTDEEVRLEQKKKWLKARNNTD